ncbi:PE-PPE domain-containing protein [Stigmatella erecta]|uniref:PE-PPE domain-containing protein n=1 Tax=Stigmatella erecta TaxID=83460 RepID=A0A1I0A2R7_9BACT|nr:PE-PPE domain-containing protein [Stigmatella erecta]SES88355.1 PE-PPE domain-containing protein [Stigmatella erecta]
MGVDKVGGGGSSSGASSSRPSVSESKPASTATPSASSTPAPQPPDAVRTSAPVQGWSGQSGFDVAQANGVSPNVATAGANLRAAAQAGSTATEPPIPSNTGTVQVRGNTMTDAQKTAAGALRIDSAAPASTYDGMYVGADGYAYPPGKFDVTQVPPFEPANPVASPTPTTYFTNGINTPPAGAISAAQDLANHTGTNVVPIYNATEGQNNDVLQTGQDRINWGDNKAVDTLANAISADLEAGRKVNVVGYSQGGAIVSHALNRVDQRIIDSQGGWTSNLPVFGDGNRREREQILSNVNVVGIAGAGKNFPAGPQYNFYVNQQDPVPNWLGVHEPNGVPDTVTNIVTGSSPLAWLINGGGAGFNAPGAQIHTFNDPAQGWPSNHGLDTYFRHIQTQ